MRYLTRQPLLPLMPLSMLLSLCSGVANAAIAGNEKASAAPHQPTRSAQPSALPPQLLQVSTQSFDTLLDALQLSLQAGASPVALENALQQLRLWSYSQPLPEEMASKTPTPKVAATKPKSQPPAALRRLDQLLRQLQQSAAFWRHDQQGLRLQEQYAVLLYRYYPRSALLSALKQQLPILQRLLQQPALQGTDASPALAQQAGYRDLELYRALGFLLYAARSDEQTKQLWQNQQPLLQWLLSEIRHSSGWQLQHQLWALAYWQLLLADPKSDATTSTALVAQQAVATSAATPVVNDAANSAANPAANGASAGLDQRQLDARSWQALLQNRALTAADRQQLFSQTYLVNSYRTRESCQQQFAEQCQLIEPAKVLTRSYDCAAGTEQQLQLRIRHQDLTQAQLVASCQLMLAQTARFSSLLNTMQSPVANDHNQRLEVMIFPDYTAYNRQGSLAFDIQTDNGGMYIEGDPADPQNQARFFSFRQFWQAEPFAVWNLAHEFVHYLDGRFNLYGGFAHFPQQTVWWSEGLAELIAQGDDNEQAQQLLSKTPADEALSLQQIFATSYDAHNSDQIYRWSYWAWRFLVAEALPEVRQLATHLRTDFFKGYTDLLAQLASSRQADFAAFLQKQRALAAQSPKVIANAKPTPLQSDTQPSAANWQAIGRYLYRSDLTPVALPLTPEHFHLWQSPPVAKGAAQ